ncbi:NIL domain-containing protein [Nostoc sp.]|uniref:NIL domain-containing protein n=1 Tax=Nostoc sp. TaxID=1180 RepID=UPI002FFB92D6
MVTIHLPIKRIRLRIPKDYHQEPVISRLVSNYGLTVNITAAILGANAIGDSWFDLKLQGKFIASEGIVIRAITG